MKKTIMMLSALTLSACNVTLEPNTSSYNVNCSAIYGKADIYRSQNNTISIKDYARKC